MDFFKSTVGRLLSSKNSGGLCRELKVTTDQAERIYSEYYCNFPETEITEDEQCNASQTSGENKP